MSYEEFRRRIDTMRQILVGAVPSPAGQIDQITYALMYKFMNDIDDQSAALGGVRTYFTGEYEKYNWHALMSPSLGAHERLELYRQAIQTMAKNDNIPELFRSIYQNAFLPFNSANVLSLFLKEADKFSHGETDDIGDAYEYLLSITGAQGDVGQFRTPRHIIKFIAEAVNLTKDDKVLDPAVGTAGFLIAAYNHVLSQHDGKDEQGNVNDEQRLTADELNKIHHNYRGFDIDPTMVRTAKVNMYLHGFKTPDIINHDSLSSEDYWNDRYDVILANPPFMTPKGGIQPHKKFGISANRAEVLFVDYIASHLKPTGRAGIVVPEGIIFQGGKAYKELRKNLVENYLYAVVSLPAGIFNPYAGVKTSVLLLDKELAKQRDEILFVKVENDGYSLGAQRRPIGGSQFPEALVVVEKFKAGEEFASEFAHTVPRSDIAESGDYNLSGDRYKISTLTENGNWPIVPIAEYVDYVRGLTYSKKDEVTENGIQVLRANNIDVASGNLNLVDIKLVAKYVKVKDTQRLLKNDIFICAASGSKEHIGKVAFIAHDTEYYFGGFMAALRTKSELEPKYLFYQLRSTRFNQHLRSNISGANINNLNAKILGSFKIQLPPIEIQREIVAELDGYQKIIDAAQTIIQPYKPTIKISPEWVPLSIGNFAQVKGGKRVPKGHILVDTKTNHPYLRVVDMVGGTISQNNLKFVTDETFREISRYTISSNDVYISIAGTIGRVGTIPEALNGASLTENAAKFVFDTNKISPEYLASIMNISDVQDQISKLKMGVGVPKLALNRIENIMVPLPPIEIQRKIVAELEAEQQLVNANKKLIEIYQQKIKSKIAEVWGE